MGAHALVGGLIAELAGGDFRTGALAAGANEAFVASVGDKIFSNGMHDQLLAMTSQLIGLTVAAAAGGNDKDQAIAGWVASQATKFNYLEHEARVAFAKAMGGCGTDDECSREKWEQGKFDEDSTGNMEYAKDIADSQRAKMARDRIMDDLDTLVAITDLTDTEKSLAQNITNGLDTKGTLTEELVESVAARQGLQPLDGGKYGGNNGFDHVYLNKDGQIVILESKQLNGGFALTQGADWVVQMSNAWVSKVLESLDKSSKAYAAVLESVDKGTLIKGVAGVDRKTGKLVIARLK